MIYAFLDLSLTSTGGAALPAGWGGDWSLLDRATFETEPDKEANVLLDTAQRMRQLAHDITTWLYWLTGDDLRPETIRVFYERAPGYAFNAHKLVALAGVVQDELGGFGGPEAIPLEPLEQNSIRKLLLGDEMPVAQLRKPMTIEVMKSLAPGVAWDSDDELDAMAGLNFGLSTIPGEFFFAAPQTDRKARAARSRRSGPKLDSNA